MAIMDLYAGFKGGSIGDFTLAKCGGKVVVKQKVVRKRVPCRSEAQMQQRMRFGNIVSLWKSFDAAFKPYFEHKSEQERDYNRFISANMGLQPIYLTKEELSQGACVVSGYHISDGSLSSIQTRVEEGRCVSNIAVGDLVIDDSTTVADLSEAVARNNGDFRYKDYLFCVEVVQVVDANGVPRVKVLASKVVLDRECTLRLYQLRNYQGFCNKDGYLALAEKVVGGVTFVHGRVATKRVEVSSQRLVVTNGVCEWYGSEEAFRAAVASYGSINCHRPKGEDYDDVPSMWADMDEDNYGG